MTWQNLEQKIRKIASYKWNCPAYTETIAGVKCDCVLKPEPDNWIIVEITQQKSVEKVREDVLKLRQIKMSVMADEIYCKCYLVMKDTPTDAMRNTGDTHKIKVCSADEFQSLYFDYSSYVHLRKRKTFGSLINIETGNPEDNIYINVKYRNKRNGDELSISDIAEQLKKGKKIILKGDFGLGKSRCIKQLFDMLTQESPLNPYVIAINLRDHWGAQRCSEILSRHFSELGLNAESFIKCYEQPTNIYLLDGFDEIGTQSWSSNIQKMHHIREMSVCALKDLISKVQGGVLLVGREYYFNSDDEMLGCLGLKKHDVTVLECHHEFTETELMAFVKENLKEYTNLEKLDNLPNWLPRRPLIMQLMLKYAGDIFSEEHAFDDICEFWYTFFSKMCEREAKIYAALNPDTIKGVLLKLANKTRMYIRNTGPISQSDLSDAFSEVTGFSPTDESSIMLQRLPAIGRISADSPDRQFLDPFILNGLRAEAIIQLSKSWDMDILKLEWMNPLEQIGLSILAEYIETDEQRLDACISLAREATKSNNKVLASDIVAAICMLNVDSLDFKGLEISGGHFTYLSFEGKEIKRLSITGSIIERFDLTNTKFGDNAVIRDCVITTAYGIASHKSLPANLIDCSAENYESLATTTLIKRARLLPAQKLFVQMLRKIFIQPGRGRKEGALLRGMGESANKQLGQKLLNALMEEKLVTRHKGDEGYIYKPVRSEMKRIDKILTDLTLSTDPLWLKISAFN